MDVQNQSASIRQTELKINEIILAKDREEEIRTALREEESTLMTLTENTIASTITEDSSVEYSVPVSLSASLSVSPAVTEADAAKEPSSGSRVESRSGSSTERDPPGYESPPQTPKLVVRTARTLHEAAPYATIDSSCFSKSFSGHSLYISPLASKP